jgi:hypothetical protein
MAYRVGLPCRTAGWFCRSGRDSFSRHRLLHAVGRGVAVSPPGMCFDGKRVFLSGTHQQCWRHGQIGHEDGCG